MNKFVKFLGIGLIAGSLVGCVSFRDPGYRSVGNVVRERTGHETIVPEKLTKEKISAAVQLILAEKPEVLRHLGPLDKKTMQQYRTLLKRERTPIEEAEFYARQMESRGLKSIAALAQANSNGRASGVAAVPGDAP